MSGFDQFFQGIEPLLLTLAPIVVPILLAYLTTAVRAAFDRMPGNQRALLASIVSTGVTASEQTGFGKLTGDQKKQAALSAIHAQLSHFGLSVPDSVIVPMLEEAVMFVNMARSAAPVKVATKDHE